LETEIEQRGRIENRDRAEEEGEVDGGHGQEGGKKEVESRDEREKEGEEANESISEVSH
jgi:hypothetical protein